MGLERWKMSDMTSGSLKDKVYAAVMYDVINGEYTVESVIS